MEIDKSLQSDDRYFNVRVTNKKQVEVMYSLLGKSSPGRDDEDKDKQSGAESHFISYQTISNSNSFVNEYNNNNNNNMSTQVTPRTATLLSCYINLCCTIIGAGMLGIPYGFSCVGWILGCILLVLCAISSGFALYFLTICGQLTKSPTSFHQVAEKAVPKYAWLVDASVAIKCYGAGISYMIIVADLMPVVMHSVAAPVSLHSRYFWVTLSFVLATPLVCFERLDSLKYTSALSILFILLLLIVVGLYGTHAAGFDPCADTNEDHCFDPTDMAIPSPWFNALKALPIFVFGYTCQQNTFVMVNEMRAPTQNKFNTVIVISLATAMLVYTITASFGYLTFGRYSLPDILTNYPEAGLTTLARVCVSAILLTHFPLQAHPARRSALSLWLAIQPLCNATQGVDDVCIDDSDHDQQLSSQSTESEKSLKLRKNIVTIVFLLTSYAVVMSVSNVGLVMSLVGATGSTVVSFILPGMCYYYLAPTDPHTKSARWLRRIAFLQFSIGLILIPFCVIVILAF